jgi:hypothetical protein
MTRARLALVAAVVAHLVLKVALYPRAADTPVQGDELAYQDGARAISEAVRDLLGGSAPNAGSIADNVIGNGWFMPGMSLVLTPLHLLVPDPSVGLIRGYLGVLSLLLLAATALMVGRTFGAGFAWLPFVVPGLLPMWVLFSFSAWGDLSAGLVALMLVCQAVFLGREVLEGRPPRLRDGAALGALAIVLLYLRSNALPLSVGLLLLLALASLVWLRGRDRLLGIGAAAVAVATFGVALAPWSIAASDALDGPVLTTSTVPIARAAAFGDVDRLCFGPCGPGNIYSLSARYSREVSRATGVSELTVQNQMAAYALEGVTARSYAGDLVGTFGRYAAEPSGFEPAFRAVPGTPPDAVSRVITTVTNIGYAVVMLGALGVVLAVVRARGSGQMRSILLKLSLLAMFAQPFLHVGTPRYWPLFLPVAALSVAWLVKDVVLDRSTAEDDPPRRWLTLVQVAIVAAVLTVTGAIAVLAQ